LLESQLAIDIPDWATPLADPFATTLKLTLH
jgi:hypothetical protein